MRLLPKWIPQTPRPSSFFSERAGYGETWDAMTPNERRWSFLLTDLPVLLIAGLFIAIGVGWV